MKALLTFILGFGLVLTSFGDQTNEPGPDGLYRYSFLVEMESFVKNLKDLAPPKSGESNQELLRRFLKDQGITIKNPKDVFINEKNGIIGITSGTKLDSEKLIECIHRIVKGN